MSTSKREDRTRLDGFEVEIFKLVAEGATSEQWREWLRAPLEHAAADGNMDLFTRLMDAGADGRAGWRGCNGRTLLGAAAFAPYESKSEIMVQALLNAGAKPDVNKRFGPKGRTALHMAAYQGAKSTSEALIVAGADPNILDLTRYSALHLATTLGHHEVVATLLVKGALPNAPVHPLGHTPLHLAILGDRKLCVSELLIGGADKDLVSARAMTPLYIAARNNRVEAAKELLAAGATLDIRSCYGWSAVDIAANRGHVDVLRVLLQRGNSLDACPGSGHTPLHSAAQVDGPFRDNSSAVRVLLEAGADIDAKTTRYGATALHTAVCQYVPSSGTIRALLEAGANVNARKAWERTPLHVACRCSSVDVVGLLLRWGADETLVDQDGKTPGELLRVGDEHYSRIRGMLARAPADRSWRRRGWLVLCRSCPATVQLVATTDRSSSSGVIVGGNDCDDSGRKYGGVEDQPAAEFNRLVRRLISLGTEGVFRSVVGFL